MIMIPKLVIVSAQGESEKQVLRAFTLKNAARQVDNPELAKVGNKRGHLINGGGGGGDSASFGPFFWVVLSVASVLVSVSVILALVIRTRCFMGRERAAAGAASGRRGNHRGMGMAPFETPNKRRRSSSGATMRFPRHEMEMGSGGGRGGE